MFEILDPTLCVGYGLCSSSSTRIYVGEGYFNHSAIVQVIARVLLNVVT